MKTNTTDAPHEAAQAPAPERPKFTYKQWKVAQFIAHGFDNQEIAERLGMHWRSVWRLRQMPKIQAQAAHLLALAEAYRAQ
jgi:DNA-binding NarL/FixJ family response regulator